MGATRLLMAGRPSWLVGKYLLRFFFSSFLPRSWSWRFKFTRSCYMVSPLDATVQPLSTTLKAQVKGKAITSRPLYHCCIIVSRRNKVQYR